MTWPQRAYLELLCATDYPEQEPAYQVAHWSHVTFLLVPVIGTLLFILAVEAAYE